MIYLLSSDFLVAPITPVVAPVAPLAAVVPSITSVPVVEPKVEEKKSQPKQLSPFEAKLKQLEEMGFTNALQNINVLVKYNGDMLNAVKHLLEGNSI